MSLCKLTGVLIGMVMLGYLLVLGGCQGLLSHPTADGIQAINHIIVMVQENRSFDSYLGQLPAYWKANGYP